MQAPAKQDEDTKGTTGHPTTTATTAAPLLAPPTFLETDPYHGFEWDDDAWVLGSDNTPVFTVFFQGGSVSQRQLAQYTGTWGFTATTGERFTVPMAMEAIRFPFVGVEAPEVVLSQVHTDPGYDSPSLCFHPLLWSGTFCADFTHELCGLRAAPFGCCLPPGLAKQTTALSKDISPPSLSIVRPPLTAQRHMIRMDRINLGQHRDVDAHYQKWQALQRFAKQLDDGQKQADKEVASKFACPCILYGVSRGAAATLNALAHKRYANVRLVILEGCYTSATAVIRRRCGRLFSPIVEFGLSMATDYKPGQMLPIESCSKISRDIPIGIVTSRGDKLVPPVEAMRLAAELRSAGHDKVHVLTLRRSRHGRYIGNDYPLDGQAYLLWLHALYQRYDLPHCPEYAQYGQDLLEDGPDNGQAQWFRLRAGIPSSSPTPPAKEKEKEKEKEKAAVAEGAASEKQEEAGV